MTTQATICDALAFIAEFGTHARGTHIHTRIALYPYVEDTHQTVEELMSGVPFRPYKLNYEGWVLAAQSPLHHCFAWLRDNDFRRDTSWFKCLPSGRFIPYVSNATNEAGFPLRSAFISGWTHVSVRESDAGASAYRYDARPAATKARRALAF